MLRLGTGLLFSLLGTAVVPAAEFPSPFNTEKLTAGFTPASEAVAGFTLPEGFRAQLFAAEPDIRQPIAITSDARGRLWIAENYTYAERPARWDPNLRDRIVILEDRDGDGQSDRRTVFWDQARLLTSVETGFGGVWALCPPNLLFIPDRDGDDVPDGAPEIVLDGFSAGATIGHNIANGLKWGPDGWLYGRQGIQDTSAVGRPGAASDQRVLFNCAIWRYHPTRRIVEVVSHGGTNAWGLDFDQHGQCFYTNTVIGHLWHVIPGAYYRRMSGAHLNPHVYEIIEQTADHFHWNASAERWNEIRSGPLSALTDRSGGGHVHIGALIYQGGTWPDTYRNALLTCNLQGHRVNVDTLHREGCGYVARHAPDFLRVSDKWFRGMELISGPDGNVFIADWNDTGECHDNDGVHRTSGRIYKISYGRAAVPPVNLARASDAELVAFQTHRNDWFARMARRLLQERAAAGGVAGEIRAALEKMLATGATEVERLRALWCLHGIDGMGESALRELLDDGSEHVRTWALRLLAERPGAREPATLARLSALAHRDASGLVRAHLASFLQRLPPADRWPIATALAQRAEDHDDRQQPLMIWYGIAPAVAAAPESAVEFVTNVRIPLVRRLTARRLAEELERQPESVNRLLRACAHQSLPAALRADVLAGLAEGLRGWSHAPKPAAWDEFLQAVEQDGAGERARELSLLFGSGRAEAELLAIVQQATEDPAARRNALQGLLRTPKPEHLPQLKEWARDRILAPQAARALARYDDPQIPALLLELHARFGRAVRSEVIETMISRPQFARVLLQEMQAGRFPREHLTAYHARHIRGHGDSELSALLTVAWGEARESPTEKHAEIARWQRELEPAVIAKASVARGRDVYAQRCAACHRLHGEGGQIGPELTGADRRNVSYLLENIIDPGAVVPRDAQVAVIKLRDGRVLSGMIAEQSERAIIVQTPVERLALDRAEIAELERLPQSLMPEGLLLGLSPGEVRDLFAYLMSDGPVK